MFRLLTVLLFACSAAAQTLPFLTDKEISALASEISGESAKRTVEGLSRQHRMRGSRGYHAAAEQVVAELKRAGLGDAHIESLPADGKIFYGTQRSRPPWNADFAELWEVNASGERVTRLASWDAAPITLAQDSWSADVTAELVDVGAGTSEADYANKDVKGKLVLASAQPGPVAFDVPANIDSTNLQRAGFIAAACGYTLARLTPDDAPMLQKLMEPYALERRAQAMRRGTTKFADWYESEMRASIPHFFSAPRTPNPSPPSPSIYLRNPTPKGPMSVFGYDYLTDKFGDKKLALNDEYRYEALNLVDGRRTTEEIRDALSAIYEPVELKDVEEYLAALASIGVIRRAGTSP